MPNSEMIPAIDRKGTSRNYITGDTVCCEVLDILPQSEKMIVGMKGTHTNPDGKFTLGLITSDNFPEMYK